MHQIAAEEEICSDVRVVLTMTIVVKIPLTALASYRPVSKMAH